MQIYKRQIELYDMPVPWLLGICFDCTVSINERDFATAQDEVALFLGNVHRRSHMLPGLPSDFVSMTAFKDCDDIFGPPAPISLVKMDDRDHVGALCGWVKRLKRDGRKTALYDSIRIASGELLEIDRRLPANYLKVVLAITDGQDNDSRYTLDELSYFNKTDLNLAVIGVGDDSAAELKRLSRYAASSHGIGRFEDLYKAITLSIRTVIDRHTYFSY